MRAAEIELDTSVVLRLLVAEPAAQYEKASVFVSQSLKRGARVHVGVDPVNDVYDDGDDLILGGAASRIHTMLIGGRIDLSNSTLPSVLAQIKAGQIRAVAIGSPKRNPKLPDVATLEEQGVSGANAASWAAFFAPAATPQPILDVLSAEIMKSLKKAEVVEKIDKLGFTVEPRDPAQFKPYQVQEIATWMKIAKDAGIQPEE